MRLRIFIFVSLLATFGSVAAHAHAFLDHASPLVGSTVANAPHEVSLTFTQNLEAAFSNVAVTGPNGARVDAGKPQISGNSIGLKGGGAGDVSRALAGIVSRYA
jgi:methionine-rich copper-binding protein CopC